MLLRRSSWLASISAVCCFRRSARFLGSDISRQQSAYRFGPTPSVRFPPTVDRRKLPVCRGMKKAAQPFKGPNRLSPSLVTRTATLGPQLAGQGDAPADRIQQRLGESISSYGGTAWRRRSFHCRGLSGLRLALRVSRRASRGNRRTSGYLALGVVTFDVSSERGDLTTVVSVAGIAPALGGYNGL